MKSNILFHYMMHACAALLLFSAVHIDAAAAKFNPQAAAAQVITQKIPTTVQEFPPIKQLFETAISQAVDRIQNFNPMQGNPIQIRNTLNQAKSSLDLARGYLSNLLAGYTKIKNLSQPKATLNAQGINDAFFKTNNDLIRDLDRQFSEKEAQLTQRARAAELDAKKQAARAAQERDIRIKTEQEAAREKQRANVQETDIDQFAQALDRAQAEATDWRLKFEATQKKLEQLQEDQKGLSSILPMLQQKASVADKSKAEIEELRAKHQAELQRLQQAHAAQAADRDAALQRALQEASQLRQDNATIAQLQTQLQQLTGHNEQLQAQVGNIAQIEAANQKLNTDLAAAHAENERNKSLDADVKRLQTQLAELSVLRAQNHALSAQAADAARLHEEQKKATADLQTARDQAEALNTEKQRLIAALAASQSDDKQRLAEIQAQKTDLKNKDAAISKLEKESADAAALRAQDAHNKQRIAELTAQVQTIPDLTEQNTQLRDRVAAAEEERKSLSEAQARIRELEPSLQKLAELQHEMDDLRKQAELAQKVPGLEAQVGQLPALQEKAAQADRANAENIKLASANARLQAQEKAQEEHAKATANRIAQLTATNEKLEKQVAQSQSADKLLADQNKSLRDRIEYLVQEVDKNKQLQRDLDNLRAENKKLSDEKSEFLLKYEKYDRDLSNLSLRSHAQDTELAQAQRDAKRAADVEAMLKAQLTAAQAQNEKLKAEAQSKNDDIQAQLDSALAQAKAAQATSASAEEELRKLRKDYEDQRGDNTAMSKALNAKTEENQKLGAELKAADGELTALKSTQTSLRRLLEELTSAVNENAAITRQVTGAAGK